jgi:mRNA-degrading endonuclease YafQ of YafQ-DinJ toxin-antitoxin module
VPPLGIEVTKRFKREAQALSEAQLDQLDQALRLLPSAFGQSHQHLGLGIRRLKGGDFEVRVGRDLRMVFTLEGSNAILRMVGNHDDVRRYLRNG